MSAKSRSFPLCVAPDQVMGFIEYLGSLGGVADANSVNRASGVDLDLLPHALEAAEMLGLVKQSSGYIMLTKVGKAMIGGTTRGVRRSLRELLASVEPFRSVMRRLEESGSLAKGEVIELLRRHARAGAEEDAEASYRCFISWVLYAHMAEYGEDDVLRPARRSAS